MPNRYNAGCGCCGGGVTPPVCEIHEQASWPQQTPDTIMPSGWEVISGEWHTNGGEAFTDVDNSILIYASPAGEARQIEFTFAYDSVVSQVFGAIVAYKDSQNYIYVRITSPICDVMPGDGTDGEAEVFSVIGGVSTSLQSPVAVDSGGGCGVLSFTVCLIEGQNGYLPVLQIEGLNRHVCLPELPGYGYGVRVDSAAGQQFAVQGSITSSHNWRADQGNGLDAFCPPGLGVTHCECVCQCQNCADTAQIPELSVDISGFTETGCISTDCSTLNGSYIAQCDGEQHGGETGGGCDPASPPWPAHPAYNEQLYCRWSVAFGGPPSTNLVTVTLYRGELEGDPYRMEVKVHCGTSETTDVVIIGDKALTTVKPTLDGFSTTFSGTDFTDWDATNFPTLCAENNGAGPAAAHGTITIAGVAVEGCP